MTGFIVLLIDPGHLTKMDATPILVKSLKIPLGPMEQYP